MQIRIGRLVALVLACIAVLAGCGADESSDVDGSTTTAPEVSQDDPAVPSLDEVSLRVGVLATTGSTRQSIYTESGAFDDLPYEVEFIDFEQSTGALEALNAGAIDVAVVMNSTAAVLAQGNASEAWTAETAPFHIVGASAAVDDPGFVVVVRSDSGIESLADLTGKQVAYARGAFGHFFFAYAAREAGLNTTDFEIVELPAAEARAAYAGGSVDALVTIYRNALPVISDGSSFALVTARDMLVQYAVSLARAGLLDDPVVEEAVGDLLRRIDAAEAWAVENVDAVAAMYESQGGLDPDEALVAAQTTPRRFVPLTPDVIGVLQNEADLFFEEEVITSEIELEVIIDDRYEW